MITLCIFLILILLFLPPSLLEKNNTWYDVKGSTIAEGAPSDPSTYTEAPMVSSTSSTKLNSSLTTNEIRLEDTNFWNSDYETISDPRLKDEKDKVENTIVGETPHSKYLASIRIADSYNTGNFTHRCSGALVTPTVVLSVAHCLHDQYGNFILHPETYRILFGRRGFSSNTGMVMVAKVAVHERYLIETKLHDLSLFKLQEAQRVMLPDLNFLREENLPNTTKCSIHVWTKVDYLESDYSLVFAAFTINLQSRFNCYFELGTTQNYLSPDHKCFVMPSTAKPSCLYNDGSPITCSDILVGLFSYASFSQQSEVLADTGVYVDVSRYLDLISNFNLDISGGCHWRREGNKVLIIMAVILWAGSKLFE